MNIGIVENIDAIEIVKELNSRSIQMYDEYYSGDKDTFVEAFNSISMKYNLGEFYDLSESDREKYSNQYKVEIDNEFNRLVLYGKEMKDFHKKVDEYLDDLIDQEKNNFSVEERREFSLREILKKEEHKKNLSNQSNDFFDDI